MSVRPSSPPPTCRSCPSTESILTLIDARAKDLGGLVVRRVLPSISHRMVGPFIFFDHMGPTEFTPGEGINVRPHPHINLATVTYLFEGEILHRDSVGSLQAIRPGAINWMTAGRGIVHSERMREEVVAQGGRLHGIQLWLALPVEYEETEPSFSHHPADTVPEIVQGSARLRVLAGSAYGQTSKVPTFSPLFYVEALLGSGSEIEVPADYQDRAAYVAEGKIQCGPEEAEVGRMLVFEAEKTVRIRALSDARVMLLGGAPFPEKRHMYWNFVSSRKERIDQAKRDWQMGRFAKVPGDEDEFIPLPD